MTLRSLRSRRTPIRFARDAFTLLEILVALAILGLLVGLAVANFGSIFGDAQNQAATLFVNNSVKVPLASYRLAIGDFPSTAEGLQALVTAPSGKADRWHGPYLEENAKLVDPWGHPYVYRYPGTHNKTQPDVFSVGKDGQEGTADDIGNWASASTPSP